MKSPSVCGHHLNLVLGGGLTVEAADGGTYEAGVWVDGEDGLPRAFVPGVPQDGVGHPGVGALKGVIRVPGSH